MRAVTAPPADGKRAPPSMGVSFLTPQPVTAACLQNSGTEPNTHSNTTQRGHCWDGSEHRSGCATDLLRDYQPCGPGQVTAFPSLHPHMLIWTQAYPIPGPGGLTTYPQNKEGWHRKDQGLSANHHACGHVPSPPCGSFVQRPLGGLSSAWNRPGLLRASKLGHRRTAHLGK